MAEAITVQMFAYAGMNLIDFSGPFEVFLMANNLNRSGTCFYDVTVVSRDGRVTLPCGLVLETLTADVAAPSQHTLMIPGGPDPRVFLDDEDLRSCLSRHCENAVRLAAVCSGAFALAVTGHLRGRRATTHWEHYDDLERCFPDVIVERGPIFVKDGHVWTSAGVTAGIDLALALVEEDMGRSVSLAVARHLVMFLTRHGDQTQFSAPLNLQSKSHRFSNLHAWMSENLANDLSVPALAKHMNMSERTFMRHYRARIGKTPGKVVESLRLEASRDLLLTSPLSIKDIAVKCGFSSEETFSRRFSHMFGTSPGQYRQHFGRG
ncbi:GlxA family transcriptional regulator [Agrobacterium tumefaciens]|uniref:AraC family transcriptional regulator n=1 Tax=Agrobacterium tumefaciens TaxID=358 RepID=A0A2L2LMS4_AGRTU|nr:GlxA family transcriptional regulator [Agrobacterium tumefaciens]AVH45627.1 AraC family transcriptional regulator [Agrobacterium tumefaciens]NSY99287.1 GlxA family transcriptional regulator [Agrobacterium tumefaciens]